MKYDISKLPKWAQQRIELLERDLEYSKAKLMEGPEDSDTFADPYYGGLNSKGKPLGKGTRIRFHIGPGQYQYVDAHISEYHLEIHGGETLGVIGRSSNGLRIHIGRGLWE